MSEKCPSTYLRLRDRLELETTPEIDYACLFLESRGQQFCVEFGTENAVSKAAALMGWELGL